MLASEPNQQAVRFLRLRSGLRVNSAKGPGTAPPAMLTNSTLDGILCYEQLGKASGGIARDRQHPG